MESRKSRNTIKNAKKGAAYGGFFGLGFGMGMGEANVEFWKMHGRNTRGLVTKSCAVGLVIGASLGALIRTSIGFFGARNNQRVCQSNMITDKTNELQNTNQTSFKK